MRPYNALVDIGWENRVCMVHVAGAWTHLMLYESYISIESITRVPLIKLMCMINGFIYTSASYRHHIHVICLCAAARESLGLPANGFQFSFSVFRWINARAYLLVVCCAVSCREMRSLICSPFIATTAAAAAAHCLIPFVLLKDFLLEIKVLKLEALFYTIISLIN